MNLKFNDTRFYFKIVISVYCQSLIINYRDDNHAEKKIVIFRYKILQLYKYTYLFMEHLYNKKSNLIMY